MEDNLFTPEQVLEIRIWISLGAIILLITPSSRTKTTVLPLFFLLFHQEVLLGSLSSPPCSHSLPPGPLMLTPPIWSPCVHFYLPTVARVALGTWVRLYQSSACEPSRRLISHSEKISKSLSCPLALHFDFLLFLKHAGDSPPSDMCAQLTPSSLPMSTQTSFPQNHLPCLPDTLCPCVLLYFPI